MGRRYAGCGLGCEIAPFIGKRWALLIGIACTGLADQSLSDIGGRRCEADIAHAGVAVGNAHAGTALNDIVGVVHRIGAQDGIVW